MGPKRSLTQISFYLITLCTFLCFYSGYTQNVFPKFVTPGFYISSITCLIILVATGVSQQHIVSTYALALDQRTKALQELNEKGNTTWTKVEPLPPSGFLYSAEITTDTSHFSNLQYQKGLGLHFKVSLK